MALGGRFYKEGLISKRTIVRGIYAQVVYLLLGADDEKMERMREAMLALTKGWDQQRVSDIVRETLDEVLTPIIYAEALELIEEHKQAGRKTVIISSSPIETVQPLGEHLGVDDVIATRAKLDAQGRYTGQLEFYAYGPHKADAIREMAVKEGIDLANSYAYSDSITDLPMLELVGNPVAVNPDRELTRVAREPRLGHAVVPTSGAASRSRPGSTERTDLAAGSAAAAVGTGIAIVRVAAPAHARNELMSTRACGPQAARTFLAMTAPSATTTSNNKSFFTGGPPGLTGRAQRSNRSGTTLMWARSTLTPWLSRTPAGRLPLRRARGSWSGRSRAPHRSCPRRDDPGTAQ